MLQAPGEYFDQEIFDIRQTIAKPRVVSKRNKLRGRFADYDGKVELQEVNGNYFNVEYNSQNEPIKSTPVSIENIPAYNPDGSPRNPDDMARESLKIMNQNNLANAGLAALGFLVTGKTKIPGMIFNQLKRIPGAIKSALYGPKQQTKIIPQSIIKGERVPGGTVTGAFGQGLTPVGQTVVYGLPAGALGFGAYDALSTSDAELDESFVANLENPEVLNTALETLNDPTSTQAERDQAEQTLRQINAYTDTGGDEIDQALSDLAHTSTNTSTNTRTNS